MNDLINLIQAQVEELRGELEKKNKYIEKQHNFIKELYESMKEEQANGIEVTAEVYNQLKEGFV